MRETGGGNLRPRVFSGETCVGYVPAVAIPVHDCKQVIFGRESVLAAASVIAVPFVLLFIMVHLFPPWTQKAKPA